MTDCSGLAASVQAVRNSNERKKPLLKSEWVSCPERLCRFAGEFELSVFV